MCQKCGSQWVSSRQRSCKKSPKFFQSVFKREVLLVGMCFAVYGADLLAWYGNIVSSVEFSKAGWWRPNQRGGLFQKKGVEPCNNGLIGLGQSSVTMRLSKISALWRRVSSDLHDAWMWRPILVWYFSFLVYFLRYSCLHVKVCSTGIQICPNAHRLSYKWSYKHCCCLIKLPPGHLVLILKTVHRRPDSGQHPHPKFPNTSD